MNGRKSTIPEKAQIPMAIVLGIVFILLCIWRFSPREATTDNAVLVIGAGSTEVQVSLDDLRRILEDIREDKKVNTRNVAQHPPLMSNPFRSFEHSRRQAEAAQDGETASRDTGQQPEKREERLAAMRLSATGIMNGSSIALIDGTCYRTGESVGGFVITKIEERSVHLQDSMGDAALTMPEVPGL